MNFSWIYLDKRIRKCYVETGGQYVAITGLNINVFNKMLEIESIGF